MPLNTKAFKKTRALKGKRTWSQRAPIPLPANLDEIVHPPLPPDEHAANVARIKGQYEHELNKREVALQALPNPITNDSEYAKVAEFVLDNQPWINASKTEYRVDEIKQKWDEHQDLTSERNIFTKGFTRNRDVAVNELMLPYRERLARAHIQQQNDIRAGLEQQKKQLLAEAQAQEELGYMAEGRSLRAQAEAVCDVILPDNAPKVTGVKDSWLWNGECNDLTGLIMAVASGKLSLLHPMVKTTKGKSETSEVPILLINQELLDYLATRMELDFNVPGCDAHQHLQLSFWPTETKR